MPELNFGVGHVVDRADDELIRAVREAVKAITNEVAAGCCGVKENILLDSLAGRGERRFPYQFAIAIALRAPAEHRAAIASAMVEPLTYAIAPILPLTDAQRLARLEYRIAAALGAAGLAIVEENRR